MSMWQPIETAPKGYSSLDEPSEWFFAYGNKYKSPHGFTIAVIRRCYGIGYGPWADIEETYYKEDFFSHWMPLPEPPKE